MIKDRAERKAMFSPLHRVIVFRAWYFAHGNHKIPYFPEWALINSNISVPQRSFETFQSTGDQNVLFWPGALWRSGTQTGKYGISPIWCKMITRTMEQPIIQNTAKTAWTRGATYTTYNKFHWETFTYNNKHWTKKKKTLRALHRKEYLPPTFQLVSMATAQILCNLSSYHDNRSNFKKSNLSKISSSLRCNTNERNAE